MSSKSEKSKGLKSSEYGSRNLLLILAVFVLIVGVSICFTLLPEALNNKHYPLVVFLASLPCIGVAGLWLAIENRNKHVRFGQTLLYLDPEKPGIGGQLGGRFTLSSNNLNNQFQSPVELLATLSCFKASGSSDVERDGSGVTLNTLWQKTAPVYQKQAAAGIEAAFVFELPDTCMSSDTTDINWQVMVKGDFGPLGEFDRTWDLHVEDEHSQRTSIAVPLNFSEKYKQAEQKKALNESSQTIPLTTDDNHLEFSSRWLSKGGGLAGVIFGAIFGAVGVYSFLDGWGAGIVFILIGFGLAGASIFAANKIVQIKIDKQSRTLFVFHESFGRSTLKFEGTIESPEQFSIVEIGANETTGNEAGIYTVNFVSEGESIKLSAMIESESAARALRDRIVSQLFNTNCQKLAA